MSETDPQHLIEPVAPVPDDELPFPRIAEAVSVGLALLDADERIEWCNHEFRRLLGGRGCTGSFLGELLGSAGSDLAEAVRTAVRRGGSSAPAISWLVFDTARPVAWRWRVATMDERGTPRALLHVEDVTSHLGALIEAETLAERHRAFLNGARDIVLLVRPDGQIVEANPAAEAAYGWTRDELVTMKIHDLRDGDTRSEVWDQMSVAGEHGILFETLHCRRDGSAFPVEVNSTGVTIGGARMLLSIIRDISARRMREKDRETLMADLERANRQLDGIVRLVSSAVGAPSIESLLSQAVRTVAEVMQADGVFYFSRGDGRLTLDAHVWPEPVQEPFSLEEGEGFAGHVAREGRAVYEEDLLALDPPHELHVRFGLRSMYGVPIGHDGEVFGVLECGWRYIRPVPVNERTMLQVAADRIGAALVNARLFERTRRAEYLFGVLNEVISLVSSTFELSQTLEVALSMAARALDCDLALVGSHESGRFVVRHAFGVEPGERRQVEGHPTGSVEALHGTLPVVRVTAGDGPSGVWIAEEFGLAAALVVPLVSGTENLGAILLGRKDADGFDELAEEFARRFASALGGVLGNVQAFEAERRIAEKLQEYLLVVDENVPGLDVEMLYRSATRASRVGGDFYDVVRLDEGRAGVLIGDVSGKGIDAAVLTQLIRDSVRAYLLDGLAPEEVLRRVNSVIHSAARLPEFASALLMVVDPATGKAVYCCAGHPPALVLSPSGTVTALDCSSTVIGALPDLTFQAEGVELAPGDVVVLYTDGLTEARSDGELFGEERLLEALSGLAGTPLAGIPERLLAEAAAFAGGTLDDDVAIVAFAIR